MIHCGFFGHLISKCPKIRGKGHLNPGQRNRLKAYFSSVGSPCTSENRLSLFQLCQTLVGSRLFVVGCWLVVGCCCCCLVNPRNLPLKFFIDSSDIGDIEFLWWWGGGGV